MLWSPESEVHSHFRDHLSTVAAVYDRRFYGMLQGKPAVIDRRYSRKARVDGIEFVNEFPTQDSRIESVKKLP